MKQIEVVAAVIEKDNKIFCAQRNLNKANGGKWEFPGGKIEKGETREEALVREIKEELDSDIVVDKYLMTVEHDYPTFHITMHAYLCTLIKGKLSLKEHNDSVWLSKEELLNLDWSDADKPIVNKLNESFIKTSWLNEYCNNGLDIKRHIDRHSNIDIDVDTLEFLSDLEKVVNELYDKDKYLIYNRPYDNDRNHVSERAIAHRFAHYFENYFINKEGFKDKNYDCEYNRNIRDLKRIDLYENGVYPDFIVHKRGTNYDNKVMFEFKTWWNKNNLSDLYRVYEFVKSYDYYYERGVSIVFGKDNVEVYLVYRKEDKIYALKKNIEIKDKYSIKVNEQSTKKYYKNYNDLCTCNACLNFYKQIEKKYPDICCFLESLNIDPLKPFELVWNDDKDKITYIGCMYVVYGSVDDNYEKEISGVSFAINRYDHPPTGIKEEHFIIDFGPVELENIIN